MDRDQLNRLTRRDILAAGLATASAMAFGSSSRALGAVEPYGPFKMGIQSYSLRHFKLDDALAKTKELGLHYWESFSAHIPVVNEPAKAEGYKRQAADSGVQVIGYGVSHFTKNIEENRKLFEFAQTMGLAYLSADPDPDSFDSLDQLVEQYGVAVGIHNHGPGHRYEKIDTIAKAIKDHHEKIGCCIDTGHFLRSKEDPVRAVEVFGKRIYGVHLKDVRNATEFTILGKGDLKTAELLKGLAKLKHNYCLALEYEENESAPMDDLRACLTETKRVVAML
ncbi:MAG TPA: sugar phosphate isomerase/epimerase [Isosphaeraceae bacterium]|jgi:sugar phosphate isomerase/epimerase|nr:sugar phosphate isomerase/epimerase [Isosphaeraceae bacterium]